MWKRMDNVRRTKIQIQIGINLQTEDTFNWIYMVNIFVSTKNWKKNKNYEFTHKNKWMSFISVVFVGIWYGSIQAIACLSTEADESFCFRWVIPCKWCSLMQWIERYERRFPMHFATCENKCLKLKCTPKISKQFAELNKNVQVFYA